jgi:hypothetical protein
MIRPHDRTFLYSRIFIDVVIHRLCLPAPRHPHVAPPLIPGQIAGRLPDSL